MHYEFEDQVEKVEMARQTRAAKMDELQN